MLPIPRRVAALTAGAGLLLTLSACTGEEALTGGESPSPPPAAETTAPATTAPEPTGEATTEPAAGEPTVAPDATEDAGAEAGAPATGTEAARAWIDALGEGDLDAAYAVLGEESRQQIGGREGLQSLSSGLSEGWGAFASADPQYLDTALPASAGEAGVVTVVATVTQEGTTERRALTLPYRIDDTGRAAVDPFAASEAPATIDQPQPGSTVGCQVGVNASVPAGGGAVGVSVDGEALPPPDVIPTDSDLEALNAELPAGLAAGEHVLTVAFVDAEDRIGGTAALFTLERACS